MYEIAIVGGGPAGLAAAINARRRNKETVVIGKEHVSSKIFQAHRVDNYLGLPEISGRDLAERIRRHAEDMDVIFIKDEIQNINRAAADCFTLLGRENMIEAAAVILATGIALGDEIEGETEFTGKGVSYCATCDAMFFKGKDVALVGYIPEAEAEAKFLAGVCAKVYFLPQYKLSGVLDERIEVINAKPLAVFGSSQVSGLRTSAGELALAGVFIERAGRPAAELIEGVALADVFIKSDANQATNIPGLFAAGDCTGKPWQISRAAGQGQVAALSAAHYLDNLEMKK
jgi:thioredoxin reductase (NADPH)